MKITAQIKSEKANSPDFLMGALLRTVFAIRTDLVPFFAELPKTAKGKKIFPGNKNIFIKIEEILRSAEGESLVSFSINFK